MACQLTFEFTNDLAPKPAEILKYRADENTLTLDKRRFGWRNPPAFYKYYVDNTVNVSQWWSEPALSSSLFLIYLI